MIRRLGHLFDDFHAPVVEGFTWGILDLTPFSQVPEEAKGQKREMQTETVHSCK